MMHAWAPQHCNLLLSKPTIPGVEPFACRVKHNDALRDIRVVMCPSGKDRERLRSSSDD